MERDDGAVLGIEVKAGHNVSRKDFAPQEWFRDNIIKNTYIGIVLYSGDRTIKYNDTLLAVPNFCVVLHFVKISVLYKAFQPYKGI